ncbi:MAG: polysaccharide biosynthesis tyrosine autokinase [Gemmatimonadota bacterium]|nr:polysaccharide biosynthesis tyrosine autokinase [Gemmatimonadota bacterium]
MRPGEPGHPYDARQLPDVPAGSPIVPRQNTGVGVVHYVEPRSIEQPLGLEDLFRIIQRQWWVVAGVAAIAVAISIYMSLQEPPTWESSTLVRIESQSADPFAGYQGANWWEDELETEIRVVATSSVAADVVEDLNLDFGVREPVELRRLDIFEAAELEANLPTREYYVSRVGPEQYTLIGEEQEEVESLSRDFGAGQTVDMPGFEFSIASDSALAARNIDLPGAFTLFSMHQEHGIGLVLGGVDVTRPDPSASLIRIAYRGGDRYQVPVIADAVANAFIERRAEVKKTASRSTAQFLREQTEDLASQLEAAENELQTFREDAQVLSLETEASTQVTRLAELQTRRTSQVSERDALRNLLTEIRSGPAGERPDYRKLIAFPSFLTNATIQDLVQTLTETETRRAELRARWTAQHPGIVSIDAQIVALENRIGSIGSDYLGTLNDQIASIDAVLARFGSDLQRIPGKELQYARLERRMQLLSELYSTLSQQLMQAEVSQAVEDPTARIVEAAVLPGVPVSPRPRRNAIFAAFLGLVAGIGLALVREQLDYTIRADEDLDQVLGAPVLSHVPKIEIASKNGYARRQALVASQAGSTRESESYRTLRTNVIYARPSRASREMLITSPGAQDGKSVTASNLAVTFAQQGRKTLLVDADLRRSVQHTIFDCPRRPGLSDFLVGQSIMEEITHPTKVANLTLIPAGATSPSPSELLSNPLLDYLLQRAREDYDAVIFDSPPVLAVTDAMILAGRIDGVVVVVRAGQTHRKAALDTLRQLRRVGAELLGVVMNDAESTSRYGSAYDGYHRDYFDDVSSAEVAVDEVTFAPTNRVDVTAPSPTAAHAAEVVSRAETERWLSTLWSPDE